MLLGCIALALLAGLVKAVLEYWQMREPLRAKVTETRMRELMYILDSEQPLHTDPRSIRRLLESEKHPELAEDDWGTSFVIERNLQGKYVIISLGRDRRRGSCCTRWVNNWDEDAVLSGDQWVQDWNRHEATKPAARP